MKKKPEIIILTGPTAVGKTNLSIKLAKAVNGEIISADSMQVYKGMDIGTAKIREAEMEGIPHHLVDALEPEEPLSVALFQSMARDAVNKITEKGKIPIVTGGTAFYIQALLYGIDFTGEEQDTTFRNAMYEKGETEEGKKAIYEELKTVDAEYAETVHYNNLKRVVRALEYYHHTGEKFSAYNERQRERNAEYAFCYFVLNDDRERLYERIDKRVDIMVEEGLLEEVKGIYLKGYDRSLPSMQAVGYKELFSHYDGECSLEEAIQMIKQDSRHYAKRQLTWFRKEKDVIWIDKDKFGYDEEKILSFMLEEIRKMEQNNE